MILALFFLIRISFQFLVEKKYWLFMTQNRMRKVVNINAETHRIQVHAIEILQCNEFMVK